MQMQYNVSLKPYNTFGIDVLANCIANFKNTQELEEIFDQTKKANIGKTL